MQSVETHQNGSPHDNSSCEQCGSAFDSRECRPGRAASCRPCGFFGAAGYR